MTFYHSLDHDDIFHDHKGQYVYVFDIDGTLADCDWRRHLAEAKKWDEFFFAAQHDKPMRHIIDLLDIIEAEHYIVLVSGRPERTRKLTRDWLHEHCPQAWRVPLFMRPDGDHRPDTVIKEEILKQLWDDGCTVHMAFDDRNAVVEMWRRNGVPCCQVAEGDF